MTDATFSDLSDSQLSQVHATAEEFEAAFLEGSQPSIENFLYEVDVDVRPYVLKELLNVEVELRRQKGETPSQGDYVGRFGDFQSACDEALAVQSVPTEPISPIDTVRMGGEETDGPEAAAVAPDMLSGAQASPLLPTPDATRSYRQADPKDDDTLPADMPTQFGRYRMLQVLGSGGMGTVYLAHDQELDRNVALKMPDFAEIREGDRARERFRREARTMATVQHPNLCPVYDVAEIDGRLYLTMAFIGGQTLHQRITAGAAFGEAEALDTMSRLARAVQHAHDAGIVHRDLKPANVMINEQGEPIVMDFGLALHSDGEAFNNSTQEGRIVGTPMYMAPEQVEGDQKLIGPRSDVYSLGVILYHMVCGQPPFEGSAYSILGKTAAGTPPPPPSEVAGIAPDVEAIVLKAMSWDIDSRYQSAEEFADALDAVKEQRDSAASAVTTRRRGQTMTAAALAMTLLAAVVTYVIRGTEVEVKVTAPEGAEIELRLAGEGRVISITSGDGWSVRAKPGTYEMSLHPVNGALPKGVQFTVKGGNTLVVSRGQTSEVTIVSRPLGKELVPQVAQTERLEPRPLLAVEFTPKKLPARPVPTKASTGRFFDNGTNFTAERTWSVEAADLDDDGDIDIVTAANSETEPSRVWRNNGGGKFEVVCELETEVCCLDVKLGDLDGDGDLDAIFGTRESSVRIWWNDGGADFTTREPQPEQIGARSICLGDVEGDGDLDVILGLHGPNRVLINDGKGQLVDSGQRLGNSETWQPALGDFDRDGDLDLFVSNQKDANRVWLNNGKGRFVDSGQRLGNHNSTALRLVDFDGDNDLDALVANAPGLNVLWENDGRGNLSEFAIPPTVLSRQLTTVGLDVADLNGDGRRDAFIGSGGDWNDEPDQVLLQREGEIFAHNEWQDLKKTWAVRLADYDGDGDIDVYLSHTGAPDRILWNASEAEAAARLPVPFADAGQRIGDNTTTDVTLVDVNGDKALDVVRTPVAAGARNEIWLNNGQGVLELSPSDLGTTFTTSVTSADVDLDGDADVFFAGHANQDELWINNGQGEFTRRQLASRSKSADFCDADGDGDLDLLVVVSDPANEKTVQLLLNNGDGVFEDSRQRLGNWTRSFVTGDIDGDGDHDFVAVNDEADEVWLNDGQGLFYRHPETLDDPLPTQQFAMGDLDGDGDFDLVAAVMHSSNVVWFNDGRGGFKSASLPGIHASKAVALSDADGDGDLDIFFGDADPRPDSLWLNDGNGNFEKPVQWFPDVDTQALAVGDLNGDGKEDLYLAHGFEEPDSLWLNSMPTSNPTKSPDSVDPTTLAELRRHRRPQDVRSTVPKDKLPRDQRHTLVLALDLLTPNELLEKSDEEIHRILISHLVERCGEEAAAIQSQTTSELIWNIRMHSWLANLEVRDTTELAGYTLDGQRSLAMSIIGPMTARDQELQGLTNADLMKLMDAFPTGQVEPVVNRIARQVPTAFHTNADTLVFRMTFNKAVQNVSEEEFEVVGSTAVVTDVRKLSTLQYDVTVGGGDLADFNGNLTLQVRAESEIADLEGRELAGQPSHGETSSHPPGLESYQLDNTAPTVAITRATTNPADLAAKNSVTFNVKFSEPVAAPAADGLVSHFPFEDSLVDSVDGVVASAHGDIQFGKGRFGKGIVLDERDHLRVLKDVTQKTLPEMSWGAWVRLANIHGGEHCIQVLCTDDTNPADYDRSLVADIRDSGDRLQWSAFHGGQPAGVGSSGVDVKAGEWTFIAATYDNEKSLMTLYVNETHREISTSFTSGHQFFHIGRNPFFGEFFHGTIDDVFVFNRALTGPEIERVRDNGFTLNPDAFKVAASGSVKASDPVTITDAGDNDPTTFTLTVRNVTGAGTIGLAPTHALSDLAGNPLTLTPATTEQHEFGTP